jgi:hypothetical protein
MATTSVDQVTGYGETVAYKAPCRLATTANITLSGLQTIDGFMTAADDRVLVKNQSTASENGIYIAAAGPWQRARDMDSNRDLTKGTRVNATDGTANGGREYYVSTSNPITVGTTSLAFTESLSSNAGASAAAAAASAAAALVSQGAAATSASNAATSASAASTSASAASTSASNASTSASTATTQASNASTSASNASTSATNASNSATAASGSATAAAGSATAASGSATTASTQATNASNSATAAATSASAAATSVNALPYTYSTTTADADPGNGIFRLNNATIASATIAYIDNQDSDAVSQTAFLDMLDDSTNTIKGQLTIRSKATATTKHVFNVTGSVVDGTGYRKVTLAYVGGAGALSNADACWLIFSRAGDKGADGAGTGDFSGPASSVTDNIVTFNGTTGKVGKDSGVAVSSLAPKANASFTGTFSPPTNTIALNTLADSAAVSVLGRSANSSGARADIAAGSDDTLLRRVSSALGFGQLTAGMVPAGLVTYAMLASAAIASNSEFQLGTASKLLSAAALKSTVAYQTLTSGTNVAWDMSLGNNASLAASTNVTVSNPTNANPLFGFVLKVTAVTSARTVSLGANFVVASGVESFPITVQTTETVFLVGFVDTTSRLVITGVVRT